VGVPGARQVDRVLEDLKTMYSWVVFDLGSEGMWATTYGGDNC